ncbi:ester cyclase [Niastella sp. OAS944]|uniref:ester cyclase n=1 Tax=Niastella sp. OAS944 TaxID=2664089 RepID=UPI003494922B|nr:putative SnoaL-like aldol condensation-catalyzing enzyme [Chitinophagaceae bacterium OAS944]
MNILQERNKLVVQRFNKEFIEKGNLDAFEEIVALDFVNRSAATLHIPAGREGIKDYIVDVLRKALTDVKVEIYDQIAEGDTVVTRKSISGIQIGEFLNKPATNERIVMHLIDIVTLKDGKYVEHWRYGQVVN